MKQMIIHSEPEILQLALMEDGILVEYASERSPEQSVAGSFYKGRIVNVVPGMQAAFVDIGLRKNAFLYVDDILHPHLEKQPKNKPPISELLSTGQEMVVQVVKESRGGKGARVTTHYSLPGRFMVYMPESGYVAVSKKISREAERTRLKVLGESLKQGNEGIIMRTVTENETSEAIRGDLEWLRKLWNRIGEQARKHQAPSLLHRESGIVQRFIRDAFDPGRDELVVDRASEAQAINDYLEMLVPGSRPCARIYGSSEPIFQAFGVKEQLKAAFSRQVALPDGGTIVLDQTEALTVIDVNTAKYTGGSNLEETVTRTNISAAREIARLLRLRDIGGIIIVDFIDMIEENSRAQVLQAMEEGISKDRTKCVVLGWTKLGLLEMTRKQARESLADPFQRTCRTCGGTGIL
ncbi:Rne/Rng family ribonuclease [Paenibacillus lemnae]|uniref:Rne/Rng family ribonuclease n=1 Tax=Paenibacillus lemnae TaxID=1330551 RepID=A0A848M3G3_PAELE|nr:Rne/Rng family ribonuclease [Paenibacillus lemnae]NMO95315.1 Rne/Rng family ribonuclease [Paenibacillus lemnae]